MFVLIVTGLTVVVVSVSVFLIRHISSAFAVHRWDWQEGF